MSFRYEISIQNHMGEKFSNWVVYISTVDTIKNRKRCNRYFKPLFLILMLV